MDLKFKFAEADVCDVIKVNQMEVGRKYPISRAKRFPTKYGKSVLFSLLESDEKLVSVFLPKRYSLAFTDHCIKIINSKNMKLNLIYNGTCPKTNS